MMIIKSTDIIINSNKNFQIIDITSKINQELINFKIKEGIVNIFSKHSTSTIVLNENEEGLLNDFENILNDLISENHDYYHDKIDNNAAAHLKAFLLSSSESIPIKNSKLDLGTWQSVFFIELDGPRRNRNIHITAMGKNFI